MDLELEGATNPKLALFATRPTILRFLTGPDKEDGEDGSPYLDRVRKLPVVGPMAMRGGGGLGGEGGVMAGGVVSSLGGGLNSHAWTNPRTRSFSFSGPAGVGEAGRGLMASTPLAFPSSSFSSATGSCVCSSLDSLLPSIAAHLQVREIVPYLQELGVLSEEEATQVQSWSSQLSREDTARALVELIKQSSLRNLRLALQRTSDTTPGHRELVRLLEYMGTSSESSANEDVDEGTDGVRASTSWNLLDPMVEVRWRQVEHLPQPLKNVQARLLGEKVYFGGGTTGRINLSSIVYACNYATNMWSALPPAPVYSFAMEVFRGELVLIGGRETSSSCVTSDLVVWKEQKESWVAGDYPPMPTARHSASVTTWGQNYLLVAGGFTVESAVNKVEVFCSSTGQWMVAEPFPRRCSMMQSAKLAGKWCLLAERNMEGLNESGSNGKKQDTAGSGTRERSLFSASLMELVANAERDHNFSQVPPPATRKRPPRLQRDRSVVSSEAVDLEKHEEEKLFCKLTPPVLWTKLVVPPLRGCSLLAFSGSLLTIGGGSLMARSSPIYAYSSDALSWMQVSTLPICVQGVCPIVLPNGNIFAVGGATGEFNLSSLAMVGSVAIR